MNSISFVDVDVDKEVYGRFKFWIGNVNDIVNYYRNPVSALQVN